MILLVFAGAIGVPLKTTGAELWLQCQLEALNVEIVKYWVVLGMVALGVVW